MIFQGTEPIPIRGKKYVFQLTEVDLSELVFWYENPREPVPQDLKSAKDKFSRYLEFFYNNENVKRLKSEISLEGGIQQPLFVKKSKGKESRTYTVFDGNSRLAAINFLAKQNKKVYGKVKCRVAPDDLTDEDLNHYIIFQHGREKPSVGKWEPDAKALMMLNLKKKGLSPKQIADEYEEETEEDVKANLRALNYFNSIPAENRKGKWSFCLVLALKDKKISKKPAHHKVLQKVLKKEGNAGLQKIGDLRDNLDDILKTPARKLNDWADKNEFYKVADGRSTKPTPQKSKPEEKAPAKGRLTLDSNFKKANGLLIKIYDDLVKLPKSPLANKVDKNHIFRKISQIKDNLKSITDTWDKIKKRF